MTTATLEFPRATVSSGSPRRGELALTLQEAFTVAVRLRANRQVAADAGSFRAHVKQLLAAADRDARNAHYDADSVKLAIYAYVAFLDESVLNSNQPMFADWPRQPLQEEIFGDHVAGENFYRYLADLLARQDSEDLADLLEVFHLCMLLGFRGRYGADAAGLHAVQAQVREKIARIRGGPPALSSAWRPPDEVISSAKDPWIRRLGVAALGLLVLAIVLWAGYRLALGSGASELRGLADRLVG